MIDQGDQRLGPLLQGGAHFYSCGRLGHAAMHAYTHGGVVEVAGLSVTDEMR